ncbi:MAG: hypothetical protein VBE63_22570 [Lamprobacter sp.]|uniref:hypothetical protein n=1 Tax=Lamprobacter sp. TaxID=3100796 RepID=UPI002B25A96D|nr:hypothetical protein [Lamprobacter sp.]MEA3642701.1 hypothetical protein [Lamprobacter sp.]
MQALQWETLGLVFSPEQGPDWMRTHAQVPTPLLYDGFIRVWFSSRPEPGLSLTSYVDLDAEDPTQVLYICPEPILPLGEPGTFDEHGIMPSCALRVDGAIYLYYSGWSRGGSVPYVNSTGLAISEDDGRTFRKYSKGPLLSRDSRNPYSATSPYVSQENGEWDMWFCSGTSWVQFDGKFEPTYDIKHARSCDGILWSTEDVPAILQQNPLEAITRPWVWWESDQQMMTYCYRGSKDFRGGGSDSYRLGLAYRNPDSSWCRIDNSLIIAIENEVGFDKMLAYAAMLEANKKKLIFFNGNDFGSAGFCLAYA